MLRHASYSLLSLVALLIFSVPASVKGRSLSPEQALSMAASSPMCRVQSAHILSMPLAFTLSDSLSLSPAVYVFGSQTPGFLIAAADDAVSEVLLGYSDSAVFDPLNIPLAMQWLLDRYAYAVGRCAASEARFAAAQPREAVAPLISSKWSQGAPFNALCPQIDGKAAPAGCVAAAVAQIMNMYQWPTVGTGNAEYQFVANTSNGEVPVDVWVDFSSHFYDWANMQNVYSDSSTPEQLEAVALLIADCGYAANTAYSHSGSGANVLSAGTGMVDNFVYDPAMKYLRREWCTHTQWSDIIYDELAQGHPVMYSAYGSIDGHTFVIDGCDSRGYLHINWGWSGTADGYYTLADISPIDPDSSSEFQSYNSNQNMIVGIQPFVNGNPAGHMAVVDVFDTNKPSYRSIEDYVNFTGGFYSFALTDLEYKIGFMADVDPPVYVPSSTMHLMAGWGLSQASAPCRFFPEGEYDVYPVFKVEEGEWLPMLHNLSLTSGKLHFVNDGTTITVSEVPNNDVATGSITSCILNGFEPIDGGEPRLYASHSYNAEFSVVADGPCFNELRAVIFDTQKLPVAVGDPKLVDIPDTELHAISLDITLPAEITPGEYLLQVAASVDGEMQPLAEGIAVNVEAESIVIDPSEIDIIIGESVSLNIATHTDAYPVVWKSSDESVAVVDEGGTVSALGLGEAVITASCCCVEASCAVRVLPVMASAIVVNPSALSLEIGKSAQLEVSIMPENTTDKTVIWTVSDPALVSVDSDGVVTALAEGSAEVTATCGEVSATCSISAFSGIISAECDDVRINVKDDGILIISSADTTVSVYALDGELLYHGNDSSISLAGAHVYLVKVKDKVYKVAVK